MTLTWKILHKQAPIYLCDLIHKKQDLRSLRSSDTNLIQPPRLTIKNSWGNRAFMVSSPALWNKLPADIRMKQTLETFKKHLKTHLFNKYYK